MIGHFRRQVPLQALNSPLPPSGSENCTWDTKYNHTQKAGSLPPEEWPVSFLWRGKASSAHCDQTSSQHSPQGITGSKMVSCEEGESPAAPPYQPKLPPPVACHTGVSLWVTVFAHNQTSKTQSAIKDRVEWTNQRESLQLPRNSGCLWEGERRKALERKGMGLTPDSLSLPSHAFSTALRPGTGASGWWESIRSRWVCRPPAGTPLLSLDLLHGSCKHHPNTRLLNVWLDIRFHPQLTSSNL